MLQQLHEIWRLRYFWSSLVKMDLQLRYRRSVLGVGWSLLNPIMMTVVFCVIFSNWHGNANWRQDAPYFLCGIAIWEFLKGSILQGCQVFFRNEAYIRQCPLPMAIYPLRLILGLAIHLAISVTLVVFATAVLNPDLGGTPITVMWSVLPSLFILLILAWALAVVAAFVQVFFQDAQHLAEVIFQIFFFLTPIIYKKEMLIEKGVSWLATLNPAVLFFDLIRAPILTGEPPSMILFGAAVLLTTVVVGLAIGLLGWLEKQLIFHL
ncbi:ABC transporter permease [Tuwongella immobilis]|uniref:Transport permease protein n=1 Tax=Tuwongella immobilis TaxID=692036 RepID=A0A6C2YVE9_9BACT|nr:ABC transporter permease [Tuwongella immobilis]VIP04959.1 abc transporter permease : Transport permease protein OS=Delftia acidovorans CCUG 274B GN=HMPREF9701_00582 PE=3 SV=1: ABC2_membrane [Tuwongella immobilis]VTS07276.1 abc transporter permease : Transport permease protein OS=Delftia acidovorans CCUG 274B GN=HMPREF9701_00582 PE=3 SV=1: ABC2_membrane [Tuwongella immobilis]